MKRIYALVFIVLFFGSIKCYCQQDISPTLYGQNAWFINNNIADPASSLANIWGVVDSSGVTLVRIGGIEANFNPLYDFDLGTLEITDFSRLKAVIDSIRKWGMEPVIQVSYDPVCGNTPLSGLSAVNAATVAANLVDTLNNHIYSSNPIERWIISNEPDGKDTCTSNPSEFWGFGYNVYPQHADSISRYIKIFSEKMKDKDNDIKIIGPGLTFYTTSTGSDNNKIYKDLLDSTSAYSIIGKIPNGSGGAGKFYVDELSFHLYFIGSTRQSVINNLTDTVSGFIGKLNANNLSNNRRGLIKTVTQFSGRNSSNLKIALTEFNLDNNNSSLSENTNLNGVIQGTDNRSFLGGQWLAHMFSVGMSSPWVSTMSPWSIREGDCTSGKGYLSGCSATQNRKRSEYWHYQMVANNFKVPGKYFEGTSNKANVTTFGSAQDSTVNVMVLNMDTVDHYFQVQFGIQNSAAPLVLAFDFSQTGFPLTTALYPVGSTDTILGKSTVLMKFDCHGTLIWKKVYSEQHNLSDGQPQLQRIGNINVDPQIAICNQPGIGGNISSNTTFSNTTVYINSDINLTGNTTLSFDNAVVVVAPNVKIKGNPNSAIEIKNNTVMLGCEGKQWGGIELKGNYQGAEKLIIDNSYIFNAKNPVVTDKVANLSITRSVFANGETAISLDRSEAFTIAENIIGGYKTGVKTSRTKANYVSAITENRFIEIVTDVDFKDDFHNMLDITCNEFRYRDRAIRSINTDLKEQGTSTLSAGNDFTREVSGTPINYIDHTGTATKYYFGPAESNKFSYPNVMNIPKIQAVSDRVCIKKQLSNCGAFVSVSENTKPQPQILIYPNPNSGLFNVSISNLPKGNYVITVHDVLGRLITSSKISNNTDNATLQINSKGLYFVSLQTGNERITKKVIIE